MINEDKLANFLLYLENQSEKDFSKWLTGVNIFEILGIESAEIRHSRVLAWLLDPRENHYLKDKFLKKFLLKVIQNNFVVPEIETTEVLLKDFSKGEVFRESKNNIDILFSNSEYKFNLIIENKIFTSDHDNQLTKYRTFVENSYVGYRNIYIYLTPNGDSPVDASIEERNYW
ncbi:PDDEXK-like family protein, partial [Streptococcus sanguinis]|uniref:PDDEXK-like family protein n=1 Tax=Streptococcus sanguinis TaxID=1305 RepID=UPI001CBCB9A2